MHALHGNGRGGRGGRGRGGGGPGQTAPEETWRPASQATQARALLQPQSAAWLRAAGWRLPDAIPGDYIMRVYDTRLDPAWLRQLLPELGLPGDPYIIGGDFLQHPHREDTAAMNAHRVDRWGPAGGDPYHLVVPPRPHVATWLERARLQLQVEASGTWVTVGIIVPREHCPPVWSTTAAVQALPHLQPLLNDMTLEVRLTAVGDALHWCASRRMSTSSLPRGGTRLCWLGTGCSCSSVFGGMAANNHNLACGGCVIPLRRWNPRSWSSCG